MMQGLDKKGWTKVTFGDVCLNLNITEYDPLANGIDRYVGLEHIEPGNLHITSWGNVADGTTFTKTFIPGHVLFGKRRAYQKKAAVADFAGLCSGDILVLEANENVIHPRFFPFLVSSDRFFDFAVQNSAGSLSPRTKFQDLAQFQFLLPPKDQQARLAELLWAGDAVVEGYGKLAEKFDKALQSAYRKYLDTTEKGQKKLGIVAEVIMGQSPDGSTYNQEGIGLPLLNGPTEFTDRYPVKVQWTSKPTKVCQKEDILLCVRGSTTGRVNISNDIYCIGRGIAAIRGGEGYSTLFLEHVLTHFVGEILRLAAGSTFPNIDSKSLKSILIPDYPFQEQESIATKFDLLLTQIREIKEHEARSRDILSQLLNQIFTP